MLTADSLHVVMSRCEQDGFVDAGCASRHGLLFYFRRECDHGDHLVHLYAYGALIWRHADCLRVPPLHASLRGLRRVHLWRTWACLHAADDGMSRRRDRSRHGDAGLGR